MRMTAGFRKFALTMHVASSVGWLGAVAGFLVLSIAGLTSRNADMVRGAYLAMNLIGQSVIVPMSIAALMTGLLQALGTDWGLFRHYWVLMKFMLTLGATALLLLHQFTAVAAAAERAAGAPSGMRPAVGQLGVQLVGDAGAAMLVLLVITAISIYKPWGRTRYGQRKLEEERHRSTGAMPAPASRANPVPSRQVGADGLSSGLRVFLGALALIVVILLLLQLGGGGAGHRGH